MSNVPEAAWVEAAQQAGDRLFEAIGSMSDTPLELKLAMETTKGTNSADSEFLDYLDRGEHLKGSFLAHAG